MASTPAVLPLRDIHLPPPVSWWPLAPGWYLVLAAVILVALITAFIIYRYRQCRLRRAAQAELARVRRVYRRHRDPRRLARDLSVLLRRICLSRLPREQVAGVTGEAWLALLDSQLPPTRTGEFSQGPGRALVNAPYDPRAQVDAEGLLALCAVWIEHLPAGSRRAA